METIAGNNLANLLPGSLRDLPPACYLVGGCVRDLLLGLAPDDYDVAVKGDAEAVARDFAAAGGYKIIDLSNGRYKLWRLVMHDLQVDFVPLNGADLAEDLGRRDFSINAMAFEPATGVFTDLYGGAADLQAKRVVMVGPDVFVNDPLRLLRAFRFAAALGFAIENATMRMLEKHAHLAAQPAAERILAELTKFFAANRVALHIRDMAKNGVLLALFPELKGMDAHRANNFSDISALEHTFRVMECMDDLLLCPENHFAADVLALDVFAEVTRDPKARFRLRLAALLHDVGKPATRSVSENGRVHYYGHEDLGSQTAVGVCRRLRCSNADVFLVSSYIGAHMKALTMFNNHRKSKRPAHKRAVFYLDHNRLLPALFWLFWADALSKKASLKEGYLDFITELVTVYAHEFLPRSQRPLPLNGHDLRKAFNPKSIMLTFMIRELAVENVVREELSIAQAMRVAKDTYYMLKSRENNFGKNGATD